LPLTALLVPGLMVGWMKKDCSVGAASSIQEAVGQRGLGAEVCS
jgi:hypothetical protein